MKLKYFKESLQFKNPAGTSRGVLSEKPSWILYLEEQPNIRGECSIIPGLSLDYINDEQYERKIKWVCQSFNSIIEKQDLIVMLSFFSNELKMFPSILFGIETLIYNLNLESGIDSFKSEFSNNKRGIPINGLIWMGSADEMIARLGQKVNEGYKILKLKIGAIEFSKELNILRSIREIYGQKVEIRVDANGAFSETEVREVLLKLRDLQVHSIEQPIEKGNLDLMGSLCQERIVPIALDEELIGIFFLEEKKELLEKIKPQYIILKPSLHGGIKGCNEWIQLAESMNIGWWLTSALESNIGLEMIARFAAHFDPKVAQGLGTGGLFVNNFSSSLFIKEGSLYLAYEKK